MFKRKRWLGKNSFNIYKTKSNGDYDWLIKEKLQEIPEKMNLVKVYEEKYQTSFITYFIILTREMAQV